MKEGTRERLRKRGKVQAVKAANVADTDTFHNHHVPCGRLLQECASDIFPTSDQTSSCSSLLGSLLRRHFQKELKGGNHKKKKKKKRKKTSEESTAGAAAANHVVANSNHSSSMEDSQPQKPPHETSTEIIMNKWMDRVVVVENDSCPEHRDLSTFLQHVQSLVTTTTAVVQIDACRLEDACESISCPSCQDATRQSLLLFQEKIPICSFSSSSSFGTYCLPSSSSLTICMDGGTDDDNVERAFDYVAMEEGDSEEILLVLHRNGPWWECDSHSLAQQLEQCIKKVVIPCGLPELEEESNHNNAPELSEQEFLQLTTSGNQVLQTTRDDLDHISNTLSRVQQELEKSVTAMTGSFDVKTSTALKDCDETLDEMLHALVVLVRRVPTSLDDGRLYHKVVATHLNEAVSDMLQAQTSHEGRLVQLANRPGAVPQMALNATHRSSYRDFLSNKWKALAKLESRLEYHFLKTLDYRNLVGYAALEKLVNKGNNNARKVVPSQKEVEEEDLLWQLYEEQTHTVQCGNIRTIKETRSQRCHDLMKAVSRRRMARCRHDISKVMANNKQAESPEFLQEACEQLLECNATEKEFPQHRQHVIRMFASEVVAGVTKAPKKIVMPLKLKQWVRGDVAASCVGGGGRQRVTCTLMGLLYKWLVDRCNEWHAELTHIELLESVMGDSSMVPEKSKGKRSKKKKKAVDPGQEAPRMDVTSGIVDRSSNETSNEVVSKSVAGVKSTDADHLSGRKENNENSPGPQHSLSTAATVSKNCMKDGPLELDVRDKKVVLATQCVEKTKKSFPSHDSSEQGLSDAKVASTLEQAEKIKNASPSHVSREPRIKSDKKIASAETRDEKARRSSLGRESREPRAKSDMKVGSSTAPVDKAKKASLRQGSREAGTKGDKEVASAVKEANKSKQSSPRGAILEPREKSGRKAVPTTQVISGGSKQPSPIPASREACASDKKPASAAKQAIDESKQPSPSRDLRKQRAKGVMKSVSAATQVNSEEKQQSPIKGSCEIGETDEKAATAVTQGEKIKQSWPLDDFLESRGKSGKKSATSVQIHSVESKEESPIQGSRQTEAPDEEAATAAVSGANETKKSNDPRRELGSVGKKLALEATQVDFEKVESSPSRASSAETAVDVGVVSPTGFQSAEVFLVERLMVVLHAETHEKWAMR